MRTARRACDGSHASETRSDGQCWLWSATPIPTTRRADGAIPDTPDRQARPPSEVGAGGADPAVRPHDRRVRRARAHLRRGHAGPRRRRGGDGDPRLGARARPRPLHGAGAVPAHGPGDGRNRGVPDSPGLHRRGGDRLAARGRSEPGDAGPRWCDHRGRPRSRRPADAGQRVRGHRVDRRAAVQGRRPRAAAGGRPRRPDRGRGVLARPALHDLRAGRRLGDGAQQRRPVRGGRTAARAGVRGSPRPPASRRQTERCPGDARAVDQHARARRADDRARGDRRRRGRRAHPGHPARRRGRSPPGRRGPRRRRRGHPRRRGRTAIAG